MAAVQKGSEEALADLFEECHGWLYSTCLNALREPEAAEVATGLILEAVVRTRLAHATGLRPALTALTYRACVEVDRTRRRAGRPRPLPAMRSGDVHDLRLVVWRAAGELDVESRTLFALASEAGATNTFLAEAVDPDNPAPVLEQLDQVRELVVADVVAARSIEDCPTLREELGEDAREPTPTARHKVARHVAGTHQTPACRVCTTTRDRWSLRALACLLPLTALPQGARERLLERMDAALPPRQEPGVAMAPVVSLVDVGPAERHQPPRAPMSAPPDPPPTGGGRDRAGSTADGAGPSGDGASPTGNGAGRRRRRKLGRAVVGIVAAAAVVALVVGLLALGGTEFLGKVGPAARDLAGPVLPFVEPDSEQPGPSAAASKPRRSPEPGVTGPPLTGPYPTVTPAPPGALPTPPGGGAPPDPTRTQDTYDPFAAVRPVRVTSPTGGASYRATEGDASRPYKTVALSIDAPLAFDSSRLSGPLSWTGSYSDPLGSGTVSFGTGQNISAQLEARVTCTVATTWVLTATLTDRTGRSESDSTTVTITGVCPAKEPPPADPGDL
ncbi:MAG TPA: hypothetical protein VGR21_05810 [Cryptosporangiaceae bacterium]|nr:hypothetical protein [Cryptosporangiaceae bacterium]